MKKLGMLRILSGAALLTVAPFSLQWSQDEVSLSLNSVNARPQMATSIAGAHRRVHRRRAAYAAAAAGVAGYGYGSYYYGYSSPYYSSYYAPQPYWSYYGPLSSYAPPRYSVISTAPGYPPSRYSYYLAPFATVTSYDHPYRPPHVGFYGWR